MPSIQHILLFMTLTLTSLQFSSAKPIAARATTATSAYTTPSLPRSGEATELPQPFSNLTLKHVTIGSGVQNYTCKSNQSAPTSIGALATLYDATTLAYTSLSTLNRIPARAVRQSLTSSLVFGNPLSIPCIGSFPIIGSHYFGADGTPTFDLVTVKEILFSKKIAGIPAPSRAARDAKGDGAVDWLALSDNGMGMSVGLGEVYRVETAGGDPPATCDGVELDTVFSVQYSAEYWFYG